MVNRLALDLGTSLGWAVSRDGRLFESGTELLPGASARYGQRFAAFRDWLIFVANKYDLAAIVYEQPAGRNFRGLQFTCGQAAITEVFCEDMGIEYVSVNVRSIKAHAGHGNANKEQMREFLRDRIDDIAMFDHCWTSIHHRLSIMSADEVDAIWIMDYVHYHFTGETEA